MPATLKDIARECGLAVSTVSNILNNHSSSYASEEVRQRVRDTAERLGYKKDYLSSSLRTRTTRSVGVVVDQIDDFTRQDFLVPFVEAFSSQGYEVALAEHRHDPDRAVAALNAFGDRVKDAVVLFTDLLATQQSRPEGQQQLAAAVKASRLKILGIGSRLKGVVPSLDIDRGSAVDRTIGHFLKDGRNVLVVYEYDWDMRPSFGYWDHPSVTFWAGVHEPDDFIARARQTDWSLFDAVFFRTDRIAFPALHWFRDKGVKIPQALSVVGFDNFPFGEYAAPALSTWDIGFHRLGLRSQQLVSGWMEGRAPATDHYELFEPAFVSRESHRGLLK